MGTNYYFIKNPCPTCGHGEEKLHIGKSSGGWCFSLHVIPDYEWITYSKIKQVGINSLDDWKQFLMDTEGYIQNEYGDDVSYIEMLSTITDRSFPHSFDDCARFHTVHYGSEEAFHASNHSERGPNNLLRHRLGRYCVGHGEGTWDLIPGEFS
jgi:hypothetical protein